MLPKPLVWKRHSLSYWQSFPQSPIQSLFSGCVQRRVKEFKFYFIPPITRTSPISRVNDCTWRHNKKYLLVMIKWGRNMSAVMEETWAQCLLCENLLSSTSSTIFFSQLVTISLIANAAEYCHQALVQSCQLLGAHAPLPVNHFTEKSIYCLLYWIQVLTVPHWWNDRADGLEWRLGDTSGESSVYRESAEAADKSLPPSQHTKPTCSLSHGTRGGRVEAVPVWMMYDVDPSLRLGL